MVTSSKDKTCRIWHIPTRQCVAVGEGHTEAIGAITLSHHTGSYTSKKVNVYTGAGDKILKRWPVPIHTLLTTNNNTIKKLTASESIRAHDKDINCIALSPNDLIVASASQDKTIRLWHSEDLTPIKTLTGHKRGIWKVVFSAYEKTLISCSGDRTVKIWSLQDYTVVRTLEGHTASVLNVKSINYGLQLLTASADGLIRCYTVRSGECEVVLDRHEDRVWALDVLETTTNVTVDDDAEEEVVTEAATTQVAKEGSVSRVFYSAGSDGRIISWSDNTNDLAEASLQAQETQLLLEQSLYNAVRQKQYTKALHTALSLQQEEKVLSIFQTILSDNAHPLLRDDAKPLFTALGLPIPIGTSLTIIDKHRYLLRYYVLELYAEEKHYLMSQMKSWNTLSQYAYVSQLLLDAFLLTEGVQKLSNWMEMKESVDGWQAYSDRHYQRLARMSQACYFLDYVTASITGILPLSNAIIHRPSAAITDSAKEEDETDKEVEEIEEVVEVVESKKRKESPIVTEEAEVVDEEVAVVAKATTKSGKANNNSRKKKQKTVA